MEFSIGDRVRILCEVVPGTTIPLKKGTMGVVVKVTTGLCLPNLDLRIRLEEEPRANSWFFGSKDVELADYNLQMVEPIFDLDDMELAEIIIEEMNHAKTP